MAENGCIRVGQTSSVYTLPIYILERAVGAFKICGSRPLNIPKPRRRGEAVSASFQHRQKCSVTQSWGIADSHYPCVRAFPECLPYSLYIIFSKKEDLSSDTDKFRGWPAYRIDRCSLCFLIRLFAYRFNTAVVWGYNLSVKLFSIHLSPVRSSCHFNRWLGCLIK